MTKNISCEWVNTSGHLLQWPKSSYFGILKVHFVEDYVFNSWFHLFLDIQRINGCILISNHIIIIKPKFSIFNSEFSHRFHLSKWPWRFFYAFYIYMNAYRNMTEGIHILCMQSLYIYVYIFFLLLQHSFICKLYALEFFCIGAIFLPHSF